MCLCAYVPASVRMCTTVQAGTLPVRGAHKIERSPIRNAACQTHTLRLSLSPPSVFPEYSPAAKPPPALPPNTNQPNKDPPSTGGLHQHAPPSPAARSGGEKPPPTVLKPTDIKMKLVFFLLYRSPTTRRHVGAVFLFFFLSAESIHNPIKNYQLSRYCPGMCVSLGFLDSVRTGRG